MGQLPQHQDAPSVGRESNVLCDAMLLIQLGSGGSRRPGTGTDVRTLADDLADGHGCSLPRHLLG